MKCNCHLCEYARRPSKEKLKESLIGKKVGYNKPKSII